MARGRRLNKSLEPSQQLINQRAFRERRAAYITELEEKARKLEQDNIALRAIKGAEEGYFSPYPNHVEANTKKRRKIEEELLQAKEETVKQARLNPTTCESCAAHEKEKLDQMVAMATVEYYFASLTKAMRRLQDLLQSTEGIGERENTIPSFNFLSSPSQSQSPLALLSLDQSRSYQNQQNEENHFVPMEKQQAQTSYNGSYHHMSPIESSPSMLKAIQETTTRRSTKGSSTSRCSSLSQSNCKGASSIASTSEKKCCGKSEDTDLARIRIDNAQITSNPSSQLNFTSSPWIGSRHCQKLPTIASSFSSSNVDPSSFPSGRVVSPHVNDPLYHLSQQMGGDETKCCLGFFECDSSGNIILDTTVSSV